MDKLGVKLAGVFAAAFVGAYDSNRGTGWQCRWTSPDTLEGFIDFHIRFFACACERWLFINFVSHP